MSRAVSQRVLWRILVNRVISKWALIKGAQRAAYSPLKIYYSGKHNSITYFCKQSTVIRWSCFLFQGHCGWTHEHNFCAKEGHTAVKTIKVYLLRFNTWSTCRWVQLYVVDIMRKIKTSVLNVTGIGDIIMVALDNKCNLMSSVSRRVTVSDVHQIIPHRDVFKVFSTERIEEEVGGFCSPHLQ